MSSITEEDIILEILEIESGRKGQLVGAPFNPDDQQGSFTNDPVDKGGATKWGVTYKTLLATGSDTPIEELSLGEAYSIFREGYFVKSGADRVITLHPHLARALCNFAIHAGHNRAVKFLQLVLNMENNQGKIYNDLKVDGGFGMKTLDALRRFLRYRRNKGYDIVMTQYLIMIGSFYQRIIKGDETQERFAFGWSIRVHDLFRDYFKDTLQ